MTCIIDVGDALCQGTLALIALLQSHGSLMPNGMNGMAWSVIRHRRRFKVAASACYVLRNVVLFK